jgi:hypothetical protein
MDQLGIGANKLHVKTELERAAKMFCFAALLSYDNTVSMVNLAVGCV